MALILKLAAEKAGWDKPAPAGVTRGVAVHESFGSVVAQIADVDLSGAEPRVGRVVTAIDCGTAVNPAGIRQQMEGAIVFGLSAALHGQVDIVNGQVQASNFNDQPVLRIHETPEVEVLILPSDAHPEGVGEPGVPPIAPAVANALFALNGQRLRSLPLRSA